MIKHIQKLLEYCYEDELKDFTATFDLDDIVSDDHVFDPFQQNHIFYHLHKMKLIAEREAITTLVLSTAHISQNTRFLMSQCKFPVIADSEYGFYVYISEYEGESLCMDLDECIAYARQLGFDEIKFDADGPIYDELPQHE
jgi:hypothetical protein